MPSEPSVLDYVDLAHAAAFRLGALEVEPAVRQVRRGARREVVDPRVMQVLVALARRRDEVVSRDDLIATCWGGVVVGENAIHRAISRLREIATAFGPGGFRIQTIPRVGYRLVEEATETEAAGAGTGILAPAATRTQQRTVPLALGGVLVTGLAISAILTAKPSARDGASAQVFLAAEAPDERASSQLERRLEAELSEALAARAVRVVKAAGRHDLGAGYLSQAVASAAGSSSRLDIRLSDARTDEVVWTGTVTRSTDASGALPTAAASLLARAIDCAEQVRADQDALDPASLRLFVTACQKAGSDADAASLGLLRTVTSRHPQSATAMVWRSLVEARQAELSVSEPAWPAEVSVLRQSAAEHLAAARRLGARPGLLSLAEAAGLDRSDWQGRLTVLEAGIAADPDLAALHRARVLALQQVGRMADATEAARRAVALAPLDPEARVGLIDALAYEGRTGLARAQLEDALRLWPDLPSVREASDRFELRFGDSRAYLRRIEDGSVDSMSMAVQESQIRPYLTARVDPTPHNVGLALASGGASGAPWPVQLYGSFGQLDAGYAMLDRPGAVTRLRSGTETLFRPYMRGFRQDPRFMALAARLGLARYWIESGHWPDFCQDPELRYRCRAAAKAMTLSHSGA